MARWSTVLSGVFLALSMVLSLGKLLMLAAGTGSNGELTEADQWLTEIGLAQYRSLFRKKGKYLFYYHKFSIVIHRMLLQSNYIYSRYIKTINSKQIFGGKKNPKNLFLINELELYDHTVVDWTNFCREINKILFIMFIYLCLLKPLEGRRRDVFRQRVSAREGWRGSLALARGGVDVARRVGSRRVIASHAVAWPPSKILIALQIEFMGFSQRNKETDISLNLFINILSSGFSSIIFLILSSKNFCFIFSSIDGFFFFFSQNEIEKKVYLSCCQMLMFHIRLQYFVIAIRQYLMNVDLHSMVNYPITHSICLKK
ncbi:hypothetical protein ALC53_13462 [Atta colombica]|uniref:Uncharacterized protein n=1 Tax=Atta colombica TaxID=520822 RepID=A0A151HY57_9HYME|nr:hypothetical protein ALC53_13462 [Atta colombica]